jgi:hypothetical protein
VFRKFFDTRWNVASKLRQPWKPIENNGLFMNAKQFISQLGKFAATYKTWWYEPFYKFRENFLKEHDGIRERQDLANYFSKLKKLEESIRAEHNLLADICNFLDLNYEIYLHATPQQRAEIRKIIQNCYFIDHRGNINRFLEDLLMRYVDEKAIEGIRLTGDKSWLLRGLVAMSMENCGADFRDSLTHLAKLYVVAEDKGLDPEPEFQRISQISSNEKPRGGRRSMQEIMSSIGYSKIVEEQRAKNNI